MNREPAGSISKPDAPNLSIRKRKASQGTQECRNKQQAKHARLSNGTSSTANTVPPKKRTGGKTSIGASSWPQTIGDLGDDPDLWGLPVGYKASKGNTTSAAPRQREQPFAYSAELQQDTDIFIGETGDLNEDLCDEDLLNLANNLDQVIGEEDLMDPADDLNGDLSDTDLLNLANTTVNNGSSPNTVVPAHPKLSWGSIKTYQQLSSQASSPAKDPSAKGALNDDADDDYVSSGDDALLLSPSKVSPTSSSTFSPSKKVSSVPIISPTLSDAPRHLQPFLNPPVPAPVLDRSPISGVLVHPRVVTHFRLGQALKYAATRLQEPRASDVIVELYARVLSSRRQGSHQFFELGDLFHYHRPPYLHADWVGWRGLPYFESDGEDFLEQGADQRICRAVGRIERTQDTSNKWRMCVLSIWKASWDDIDAVKGIVCI